MTKEFDHAGVELPVEFRAVEALEVGAEVAHLGGHCVRTRRQEGEVARIRHCVEVRLDRKAFGNEGDTVGRNTVSALFGPPQLDRKPDVAEGVLREEDAQGIRDDGSLDARVMC